MKPKLTALDETGQTWKYFNQFVRNICVGQTRQTEQPHASHEGDNLEWFIPGYISHTQDKQFYGFLRIKKMLVRDDFKTLKAS